MFEPEKTYVVHSGNTHFIIPKKEQLSTAGNIEEEKKKPENEELEGRLQME